jgi:hypothetical protein
MLAACMREGGYTFLANRTASRCSELQLHLLRLAYALILIGLLKYEESRFLLSLI